MNTKGAEMTRDEKAKFPSYVRSDCGLGIRVGDSVSLTDNSHCLEVGCNGFKQGYATAGYGNAADLPGTLLAVDCVLPTTGIEPKYPNDAIISVGGKVYFTKLAFLKKCVKS